MAAMAPDTAGARMAARMSFGRWSRSSPTRPAGSPSRRPARVRGPGPRRRRRRRGHPLRDLGLRHLGGLRGRAGGRLRRHGERGDADAVVIPGTPPPAIAGSRAPRTSRLPRGSTGPGPSRLPRGSVHRSRRTARAAGGRPHRRRPRGRHLTLFPDARRTPRGAGHRAGRPRPTPPHPPHCAPPRPPTARSTGRHVPRMRARGTGERRSADRRDRPEAAPTSAPSRSGRRCTCPSCSSGSPNSWRPPAPPTAPSSSTRTLGLAGHALALLARPPRAAPGRPGPRPRRARRGRPADRPPVHRPRHPRARRLRRAARRARAAGHRRGPGRPVRPRRLLAAAGRADRGFSYSADAPLDMRMDPTRRRTAADVVNTYSAGRAGPGAARLRRGAVRLADRRRGHRRERAREPFTRTARLAELVRDVDPGRHPAHRGHTRPSGPSRPCASRSTTSSARSSAPCRPRSTPWPSAAGSS